MARSAGSSGPGGRTGLGWLGTVAFTAAGAEGHAVCATDRLGYGLGVDRHTKETHSSSPRCPCPGLVWMQPPDLRVSEPSG